MMTICFSCASVNKVLSRYTRIGYAIRTWKIEMIRRCNGLVGKHRHVRNGLMLASRMRSRRLPVGNHWNEERTIRMPLFWESILIFNFRNSIAEDAVVVAEICKHQAWSEIAVDINIKLTNFGRHRDTTSLNWSCSPKTIETTTVSASPTKRWTSATSAKLIRSNERSLWLLVWRIACDFRPLHIHHRAIQGKQFMSPRPVWSPLPGKEKSSKFN